MKTYLGICGSYHDLQFAIVNYDGKRKYLKTFSIEIGEKSIFHINNDIISAIENTKHIHNLEAVIYDRAEFKTKHHDGPISDHCRRLELATTVLLGVNRGIHNAKKSHRFRYVSLNFSNDVYYFYHNIRDDFEEIFERNIGLEELKEEERIATSFCLYYRKHGFHACNRQSMINKYGQFA